MIDKLIHKIKRKWMKLRLQPIRVFCFHHVSEKYDAATMWEEDWTQTEALKQFVKELQSRGYVFISLLEAHERLKHDRLRGKKYAVLTSDDGFKTLLNILPWLQEQQIPITLFVNPKYIVEEGIGENVQERLDETKGIITNQDLYLQLSDVRKLESPLITFGYHGYEHLDEWKIDEATFVQNLEQCIEVMKTQFPNVIPYYAHTYDHARVSNVEMLWRIGITPIYTAGNKNYNDGNRIDRELVSMSKMPILLN